MTAALSPTYGLLRCPRCGVRWAVTPVPSTRPQWALRRARLMVEAAAAGFQVAPYVLEAAKPLCPSPACAFDVEPLAVIANEAIPTPGGWLVVARVGEPVPPEAHN